MLYLIRRVLVQPLNQLQQVWSKVADGDLGQHIQLESLANQLNDVLSGLRLAAE
jgi:hypothetical protein